MSRLQKVDGPAGIGRNPAAPGRLGFRVAVVFRNVWFLAAVTAGTAVARGEGLLSFAADLPATVLLGYVLVVLFFPPGVNHPDTAGRWRERFPRASAAERFAWFLSWLAAGVVVVFAVGIVCGLVFFGGGLAGLLDGAVSLLLDPVSAVPAAALAAWCALSPVRGRYLRCWSLRRGPREAAAGRP
ncbi:hypothetical protein [Streptomyces atacamensis]|uniref:hypothetical protein n=1 Tax=Streptomyces atacamensis TaxID=531966 RepID=UPI00399CA9C2